MRVSPNGRLEPTAVRSPELALAVSVADRLNERERLVVLMRSAAASFGTIGDRLGVTRQRARELLLKSLRRAPFLAGDLAFSYPEPPVDIPPSVDAARARKRAAARRRRLLLEQGRRERQRISAAPNVHGDTPPVTVGLLPACREMNLCTQR
jgi:hypothetical protein